MIASGCKDRGGTCAVHSGDRAALPSTDDAGAGAPIAWIREDYPLAIARGRERNLPVVVDLWAAWCHTCMAMDATVLAAPELASYADRFVWVAIDREREVNAAIMERLPVPVSPAYYVLDPRDESVHARLLGGATLAQFASFLEAGEASFGDPASRETALGWMRQGDAAAIAGNREVAERAYALAYARAPAGWPRYPDLVLAHVVARRNWRDYRGCAELAAQHFDRVSEAASASIGPIAYEAEMCAREVEARLAARVRKAMVRAIDANLAAHAQRLSAIDRAELLQMLRFAQLGLGDEAAARMTARAEREVLDRGAQARASVRDKLAYWIASVEVYAFLDEYDELIPSLEAAVREVPDLYHPHYLLAQLRFLDGNDDEALRLAETALSMSYGPQRGFVHELITEIYVARGDATRARAARDAWLAFLAGLRPGHADSDELSRARMATEHAR